MDLNTWLILLSIVATVAGHVVAYFQRDRQIKNSEENLKLIKKKKKKK